MKILIINIDSKIPNLALKKIEIYHKQKGDEIILDIPMFKLWADKIYVSCIFDWNKDLCAEWEGIAEIGGSGYDLDKKLPEEIDKLKPKLNWGFTTRGCIRNCDFCIVQKKEGSIHSVGDIYDIWDSKNKKLMIMDNNILAMPEHFKKICAQLRKEKLRVDFNQGLDHRLLTPDLCKEILSLKHTGEIRFAFDDVKDQHTVKKALNMLKKAGLKDWQSRWYIYIGVKDTIKTVLFRMNLLRDRKQKVYVMRDKAVYGRKKYIALAAWGNMMGAFKFPFKDILLKSKRMKPYAKYFKHILPHNKLEGLYYDTKTERIINKLKDSKKELENINKNREILEAFRKDIIPESIKSGRITRID